MDFRDDDEQCVQMINTVKWYCTYLFTWSFSSRYIPPFKRRELSARIAGLKREMKIKFNVSDIDIDFPSRTCTFYLNDNRVTLDW